MRRRVDGELLGRKGSSRMMEGSSLCLRVGRWLGVGSTLHLSKLSGCFSEKDF